VAISTSDTVNINLNHRLPDIAFKDSYGLLKQLTNSMELSTTREIPSSVPNSQELFTCPYPEPDQSSPHHPIPPLQDPS
jgi:hypothetical protein